MNKNIRSVAIVKEEKVDQVERKDLRGGLLMEIEKDGKYVPALVEYWDSKMGSLRLILLDRVYDNHVVVTTNGTIDALLLQMRKLSREQVYKFVRKVEKSIVDIHKKKQELDEDARRQAVLLDMVSDTLSRFHN